MGTSIVARPVDDVVTDASAVELRSKVIATFSFAANPRSVNVTGMPTAEDDFESNSSGLAVNVVEALVEPLVALMVCEPLTADAGTWVSSEPFPLLFVLKVPRDVLPHAIVTVLLLGKALTEIVIDVPGTPDVGLMDTLGVAACASGAGRVVGARSTISPIIRRDRRVFKVLNGIEQRSVRAKHAERVRKRGESFVKPTKALHHSSRAHHRRNIKSELKGRLT
jgi:hypothetical protein